MFIVKCKWHPQIYILTGEKNNICWHHILHQTPRIALSHHIFLKKVYILLDYRWLAIMEINQGKYTLIENKFSILGILLKGDEWLLLKVVMKEITTLNFKFNWVISKGFLFLMQYKHWPMISVNNTPSSLMMWALILHIPQGCFFSIYVDEEIWRWVLTSKT